MDEERWLFASWRIRRPQKHGDFCHGKCWRKNMGMEDREVHENRIEATWTRPKMGKIEAEHWP
jgi:hypothetical protein